MACEGGAEGEDAEEAAGMEGLCGVAAGDAEGVEIEKTAVGWCEEGAGDNESVF